MLDRVRDRMRGRAPTGGRPAEVWTLAGLYAGGATGCLIGSVFPMSDRTPVGVGYTFAAVCAVVAVLVWTLGAGARRTVLHVAVALGIVINSVLVSQSATPQGEVVTAFAFLWVAVYAAHFFSRREAWLRRLREGATIGWSAGTAVWSPYETFESCLSRADRTLYQAKSGRDLPRPRTPADARAAVPDSGERVTPVAHRSAGETSRPSWSG